MTKKELRSSLMDHQLAFLLHGGQITKVEPKKIKEVHLVRGKSKRVYSSI